MRRPISRLAIASLVAMLSVAAPVAGGKAPYRRGQVVEIGGTVADPSGTPVEGVTVVLLATHKAFSLRRFRSVEEGLVRVPTRTDAGGHFRLEWRWNPYYDVFRIRAEGMAAAPTAASSGALGRRLAVLAETDITRRLAQGSPVVVALEVADAAPRREQRPSIASARSEGAGAPRAATAPREPVTATREAVTAPLQDAIAQSDDQKRVFEEMGKPDRVDRLEMPGGDEVAWWYFERGKSFHFRAGRLDQVMEFAPVVGSPASGPGGGKP